MPKISKYFQATSQMLLCYEYDKESPAEDSRPCVCYQSVDGRTCIQMCGDGSFHDNAMFSKYDDPRTSSARTAGYAPVLDSLDEASTRAVLESLRDGGSVGRVFEPSFSMPVRYDRIRIYLITGYVMNMIGGIALKVSADRSDIETPYMRGSLDSKAQARYYCPKGTRSVLCNAVVLQERLKDMIEWLPAPMYMNGKFYDRCIDIPVPSAWHICNTLGWDVAKGDPSCPALSPQDILNIRLGGIMIEFETISRDSITSLSAEGLYGKAGAARVRETVPELADGALRRIEFSRDDAVKAHVKYASNSDCFNVRLACEDDGTLLFYPVYGTSPASSSDVNIAVMNAIESGAITMNDDAYRDAMQEDFAPEDFYEMYGEDARQWIIMAELTLVYEYMSIHAPASAALDQITWRSAETKTYAIDYTGKTLADESFWRIRYKPSAAERFGMECRSLLATVNMRLCNRCNGADVIRTATMRVPNAGSLYGANSSRIDVSGLRKWKIVNRVESPGAQVGLQTAAASAPAVLRTWYDSTELTAKDSGSGSYYSQGMMTLRLYREAHSYKLTLYSAGSDGTRIPMSLAGNCRYFLSFPSPDGGRIRISASGDSSAASMAAGELMFRIGPAQAKSIMSVSAADRYFAVVCESSSGSATESSALYEGKVDWITS